MREFMFVVAMLALLPAHSLAQVPLARAPQEKNFQVGAPLASTPANPPAHCCKKAAIIGAAIGAGLCGYLGWRLCDGTNCTSATLTGMAVCGGLGAGIGAMIYPDRVGAAPSPTHSRVAVASGVRVRLVTLRF